MIDQPIDIRNKRLANAFYFLAAAILIYYSIRGGFIRGDFGGYVIAGDDAWHRNYLYNYDGNTWPPLFSIFCIPIAWGNAISHFWVRFIWQLGSLAAFVGVVHYSLLMLFGRSFSLSDKPSHISIQSRIVLVPTAIMLKFLMDNFSNIQINVYFLLLTILSMLYFQREKYLWAGFLLALTISLKVYTIFFLLYFIFKREFRMVTWTFLFMILLNSLSFLYWGVDIAVEYYSDWYLEVVQRSDFANHKNQSIFGTFYRFFTAEDPAHNMYVNWMSLGTETVKKMTYASVGLIAAAVAFLLRNPLKDKRSLKSQLEYALIFAIVPILSPMSWKAYFVFLWIPYVLLYLLLFRTENSLPKSVMKRFRILFALSIVLNVFSAEIFTGVHFSDLLEAYSVITFGSIIVGFLLLRLRLMADQFKLEQNLV